MKRRPGSGPWRGLHPRAFRITTCRRPGSSGPCTCTEAAARRVVAYLAELAALLGADWLDRGSTCPAREAYWMTCDNDGTGGGFELMRPCTNLMCPGNTVGYVGELGLPVLFVRAPPANGPATCRVALAGGDTLTLAEIGAVWHVSRQRVKQTELAALAHARAPARRMIGSGSDTGGGP